mgnify:CR=1 FL=1
MLKSTIDKATGFEKRFENIGTVVYQDSTLASKSIAQEIANLIKNYNLNTAHIFYEYYQKKKKNQDIQKDYHKINQ